MYRYVYRWYTLYIMTVEVNKRGKEEYEDGERNAT